MGSIRITRRMLEQLEQVNSELVKDYRYWKECVEEDYGKYGGVGTDTWHEYKKVREKVIKQLNLK